MDTGPIKPLFNGIPVHHAHAFDRQLSRKSFYSRIMGHISHLKTSRPCHEMKAYFAILHSTAPDTGTYHTR